MTIVRGRTRNSNDGPVTKEIVANSTTAVTLWVANSVRLGISITNTSNRIVWVRKFAASANNDKIGKAIWPRTTWYSLEDRVYPGEYSVIVDVGADVTLSTEED